MTISINISKAVDEVVKIYFDHGLSINQAIDKAKEAMQNEKMAKVEENN